jgi:hypothetical protein
MKRKVDQELKHAKAIARMYRNSLRYVTQYDATKKLMVLRVICEKYELMTYSGKSLFESPQIKLGMGGFFINFDENAKLYKLMMHENDDDIKLMAEAETLLLLKNKIEQVDPGRLLGFKF